MTYPRMNKEEYPVIPVTINSEEDYKLVIEYLVFSATKIEELQQKSRNPFLDNEESVRLKRLVSMSLDKYDRMSALIDDYRARGG